jgi:hypothetical protein
MGWLVALGAWVGLPSESEFMAVGKVEGTPSTVAGVLVVASVDAVDAGGTGTVGVFTGGAGAWGACVATGRTNIAI